MGEVQEVKGLKITRPGTSYYFDGGTPACPMCNSSDLEYRCRVEDKDRTARFKCRACSCKFEKTRTLSGEPEGYTPPTSTTNRKGIVGTCPDCGERFDIPLDELVQVERVTCTGCGFVIKDRTGEQA